MKRQNKWLQKRALELEGIKEKKNKIWKNKKN